MQEKKNQEKPKPLPELEKEVTEILVANGRSFQPFIRTFSYTGENVSKQSLGTLLGVFEVDERSEDSAYIVNFLASVAKKEYFNNPRRGAIESFEAALHKVNLALAELVKHGNVSWLGKLHGALGVLEKNNLHFSVTGKAEILLLRNGNCADISEGLASDESHIHPIKTFIEVSSGRLMLDDRLIFTSPELFSLFSLEDLEKNAARMDKERFAQFMKTALINELDMAGTLVIDFKEGELKKAEKLERKKAEILPNISNVFSQSAFIPKKDNKPEQEKVATEPMREEYVDTKTGHIYIQGDLPDEKDQSPFWENFVQSLQDAGHATRNFFTSQSRWVRKAKKQSLLAFDSISEGAKVAMRKTARSLRKQWKKKKAAPPKVAEPSSVSEVLPENFPEPEEAMARFPEPVTDIPQPVKLDVERREPTPEEAYRAETTVEEAIEEVVKHPDSEVPDALKEKLANFYKRGTPEAIPSESPTKSSFSTEKMVMSMGHFGTGFSAWVQKILRVVRGTLSIVWENTTSFYKKLEPLHKKVLLGGIVGVILLTSIGAFFFSKAKEKIETPKASAPQEQTNTLPPASSFPNEKNAIRAENPLTVVNADNAIVATVVLDNDVYIITPSNIINVRENRSFPLPGSSSAQFASAMDDLRLIFVLTENKRIYAWSPINSSFTENNLPLAEGAEIEDIGTYLTYLYVLDSNNDQIYRFPRAEGGFGAGTIWLRDLTAIDQESKMTVNETIFMSPMKSTVGAYFRGRLTRSLESPSTPLSVTKLYTHSGLTNVYALDRDNKRVLVWNLDGNLVAQYFHDKFGEGKNIAANERTGEILLTTDNNTLLSFKLNR